MLKTKKFFLLCLLFGALLPLSPALAAPLPSLKNNWSNLPESSLSSNSAIVIDYKSGKVLYSKNPDAPRTAASLTKVMTSVIWYEQKPLLKKQVAILDEDEVGGGRLRVATGTVMTANDLLHCALVGSANNAAMALMRTSGLGAKTFIDQMNVRAVTLGMPATKFYDAAGMDARNTTSARDMAKLVAYAFENRLLQKAAQTGEYKFTTQSPRLTKNIKNTNQLLLDENGLWIVAGKTGYLDEAKYNLAIRVKDPAKKRELVVVTLGAESKKQSFDETEKLTKWAWGNYVWP
jgi:D-alanyl-D-alanine endopeptidase (penicillin-binding protein 7)